MRPVEFQKVDVAPAFYQHIVQPTPERQGEYRIHATVALVDLRIPETREGWPPAIFANQRTREQAQLRGGVGRPRQAVSTQIMAPWEKPPNISWDASSPKRLRNNAIVVLS